MTGESDGKVDISRRDALSVLGAGGVGAMAGLSGCFDAGETDAGGIDPVEDRVEVDPESVVEGGTLRTAVQASPESFDAAYSSTTYTAILTNLLYEGLIATSASGEIVSWLADSYEQVDVQDVGPADYDPYMRSVQWIETDSGATVPAAKSQIVLEHPENDPETDDRARVLTVEDTADAIEDGVYGTQFRFELHEDVRFHDGQALTTEDVVASYERLEGSDLSGQVFDSLLSVQADGDHAVQIYAQEPDATALRSLGGWPIYPAETARLPPRAIDPREGNAPVGTGPWVLEEFEAESYATFSRNEDYWFDTELKDWFDGPEAFPNGPVIDAVDVRFVPDPSQRSAALQNGELDVAFSLPTATLDDYRTAEGYRAAATQGAGYTFLQFPVGVPPFDDARVRRAVNHAIPRETISEDVFSGWEQPAWIPLPPLAASEGATDYDELVDDLRHYNEYDPERAEELVEDADDDGDVDVPVEVVIETNADDDDRVRANELLVESLNQTPVFDARLETNGDITSAAQRYMDPTFHEEGHLVWISLSAGFDPHDYAKDVHHPANFGQCCNFQNVDDTELNELLRDARYGVDVVEDPQLRRERYDAIWERILELNANSYVTHSMVVGVVNDADVHGFNTYPSEQDVVGYALYAPMDEQLAYLDRE